ncbi:MAG: alpha-L-fucosidase [Acidobacteriaceae bacterium]
MKRMDRRGFCLGLGALTGLAAMPASVWAGQGLSAAGAGQLVVPARDRMSAAQRAERTAWWEEARFGMFIHWGLYAELAGFWQGKEIAGLGEWIMNRAKIPVAEYKKLAATFDPKEFDAHEWVSMAKASGVKYMVITAKHHDGFAMFRSRANRFNIVDATPFHRDPLRELAIACHEEGIRFGFYYSQDQDWTYPGAAAIGGHWDAAQSGSFAKYIHDKAIPQIRELLTNYEFADAPAEIWFDTPTKEMTPQLASEIVRVMNQHPNVLWNNRLGGGYQGDYKTPEQHIPPQGFPGVDWETCMTINDTWGYKRDDTNFKSVETLLWNLIDIASKGGNYLLNVGPTASGVIPEQEQGRMLAMGRWLAVNGEAIYGTHVGPFSKEHGAYSATQTGKNGKPVWVPEWDWRATAKGDKVYVSILDWPGASLKLPALDAKVQGAYMLADPGRTALKFSQDGNGLTVMLPGTQPDPIASVLVLRT